jgi:hypothetical protein
LVLESQLNIEYDIVDDEQTATPFSGRQLAEVAFWRTKSEYKIVSLFWPTGAKIIKGGSVVLG